MLHDDSVLCLAGYHLLSLMYGQVMYIPRSEYALRETMLQQHAARIVAEAAPGAKVTLQGCLNRQSLKCSLERTDPPRSIHAAL